MYQGAVSANAAKSHDNEHPLWVNFVEQRQQTLNAFKHSVTKLQMSPLFKTVMESLAVTEALCLLEFDVDDDKTAFIHHLEESLWNRYLKGVNTYIPLYAHVDLYDFKSCKDLSDLVEVMLNSIGFSEEFHSVIKTNHSFFVIVDEYDKFCVDGSFLDLSNRLTNGNLKLFVTCRTKFIRLYPDSMNCLIPSIEGMPKPDKFNKILMSSFQGQSKALLSDLSSDASTLPSFSTVLTSSQLKEKLLGGMSLTSLNLKGSDKLSDNDLSTLSTNCPNLESLNLSGLKRLTYFASLPISSEEYKPLMFNALKYLDVSFCENLRLVCVSEKFFNQAHVIRLKAPDVILFTSSSLPQNSDLIRSFDQYKSGAFLHTKQEEALLRAASYAVENLGFQYELFYQIENSRGSDSNNHYAANALTVLSLAGVSLAGRDFSGAFLNGAKFINPNCFRTNFSSTSLLHTEFYGGSYIEANFSSAIFEGSKFQDMPHKRLNHFDLSKAHNGIISCLAYRQKDNILISCADNQHPSIWDVSSGKLLKRFETHESVHYLAFSPTAEEVVTAGVSRYSPCHLRQLEDLTSRCQLSSHQDRVYSLAYSPAGDLVATSSGDKSCIIWSALSAEIVHRLNTKSCISMAAFDLEGAHVATASDEGCFIWDVVSGKRVNQVKQSFNAKVWRVAYSPCGNTLAVGASDGHIEIWDASCKRRLHRMSKHRAGIHVLIYNNKGNYLVSGSMDNDTRIWDVSSGKCLQVIPGHHYVGYACFAGESPGHWERLCIGYWNGSMIMWEISMEGTERRALWSKGYDPRYSKTILNSASFIEAKALTPRQRNDIRSRGGFFDTNDLINTNRDSDLLEGDDDDDDKKCLIM